MWLQPSLEELGLKKQKGRKVISDKIRARCQMGGMLTMAKKTPEEMAEFLAKSYESRQRPHKWQMRRRVASNASKTEWARKTPEERSERAQKMWDAYVAKVGIEEIRRRRSKVALEMHGKKTREELLAWGQKALEARRTKKQAIKQAI